MISVPRGLDLLDCSRASPRAGPAWEPVGYLYLTGPIAECRSENLRRTFAHVRCVSGHVLRATAVIHEVLVDGTLSPSWVCTAPGCTWHVHIRLEGWDLGAISRRPDLPGGR